MRQLLHTALDIWFLIVMTMAQGCAGPAQNANTYAARDVPPSSASRGAGSVQGGQISNRVGARSDTAGYVPDSGASTALTDHLKQHRLPLVGAQVMRNPNNGARTVVLYGFVGSDFGKSDAQRQAEDYINDPSVDVENRIRVNPELLAAGRSSPAPSAAGSADMTDAQQQASSALPGAQSYVDQQNQAAQVQQYQQQSSAASMSSMLPLVALLGILSMANGSGGFSTGPPMGYSPYGNSPFGYSPYANSPYSPYSPYAAPIPPSNFGSPGYGYGAPGGVTPFGSLPGSPYRSFP